MRAARRRAGLIVIALGLVAIGCTGDKGVAGTRAVDHGSITGSVKDASGSPIAAVSVSTVPPTVSAQSDGSGSFTLAAIPIGAYDLLASKAGYADGKLTAVGVGAGAPVQVSFVLVPTAPTVGSVSGTIRGRTGHGVSAPIAGAQVCIDGVPLCTTSASDGTYTLTGVSPGFVFVSAVASPFLPGETRQAVNAAAGGTATGVDVTLSGQPPSSATYVGSPMCVGCHDGSKPGVTDVVSDWKSSAHFNGLDRALGHVDLQGWPAAPTSVNCGSLNGQQGVQVSTRNTNVTATAPAGSATCTSAAGCTVFLVRWDASCNPALAMAFSQNGTTIQPGDTIIPVTGTVGGVATGAGQCGNGGILPADKPCSANLLGGSGNPITAMGWWQQEYLVDIGPGPGKPSWVTWTTTANDMLVLPAAWNQRSGQWVPAPDYNPASAPSGGLPFSTACSGCHETGLSLALDSDGNVTTYGAASSDIGCEKCHGPGSGHVSASGDARLIIHPAYLTAQSEREVCGQCHSQGVASTSPSGAFGFAWNDQATAGGGNFIPGVHNLSDFQSAPNYGQSDSYWPSGFPSVDHITYLDFQASVHTNNTLHKLACSECHSGHRSVGGPIQFQRSDPQTGDQYVFQDNDAVLRNDVLCLSCHATLGWFGSVTVADVARYHVSTGGTVLKNGTGFGPSSADEAQSTSVIASAVDSHMWFHSGMSGFFDPAGTSGSPSGRCSSCHMAKTAATGQFYSATSGTMSANVIGDVSSHVFRVATPDDSLATIAGASTWDGVMPNACGSCHTSYLFWK